MARDLESCWQRIDDLADCERSVRAEASFTPGDDYRPVVDLVLAAAEVLDPPLSPARLHDLRLAVTEACSNAVKVHRPEALADPVVVSCEIDDEAVRVAIRDRGPGFDPADRLPLPDPADPERLRYEHGLGVELICTLADDVAYRREADGTSVVLRLRR